jgi:predicted RNase H-like HicB family nuclease
MGERVLEFEVLMEPDDGAIHIWCPALKGCHSFGATREEAMDHIREAIEGWLESAEELGIPIPERGKITVNAP